MAEEKKMQMMSDVDMKVSVEIGRTERKFRDIIEMKPGDVYELNTTTGDRVDFLVNGILVAKGEVMVMDGKFSVRVTDIVGSLQKAIEAGLAEAS